MGKVGDLAFGKIPLAAVWRIDVRNFKRLLGMPLALVQLRLGSILKQNSGRDEKN